MGSKTLRIGMVVGEPSGDLLAAGLIKALQKTHPNLIVEGVAGPAMLTLGCKALFPMEKLSVMGLIEPIKHLPEILSIRRQLKKHFLTNPPDVFIGVDAPDFNIGLELALKKAGIKTVHYVSPSVWAWRKKRIYKIKRAVDLMLCLLPFERSIYQEHQMKSVFVGHPLANDVPLRSDPLPARQSLNIPDTAKVLALLPGSRKQELHSLVQLFLKTAQACEETLDDLHVVVPLVNAKRRAQFEAILQSSGVVLPHLHLLDGRAHLAMQAADVVLLASGTATLEVMLVKRPMVVAYKMSWLSYQIARWLVHTPFFSFPNLLNQKAIVPEFVQGEATVENLSKAVLGQFAKSPEALVNNFTEWHERLKQDASVKAAEAVLALL